MGAAEADPSRIMEASAAGAMQIQKHLKLEPTRYLEEDKKKGLSLLNWMDIVNGTPLPTC